MSKKKEAPGNLAAMLKARPKVRVIFLSGSQPHEKGPISFDFQGMSYYNIPRDTPYDLPDVVVKHLQSCTTGGLVQDGQKPNFKRVEAPTYPMQVVGPVTEQNDAEAPDAEPGGDQGA